MAGISVWMAKTDLVFGQIATVFFGSIALLLLVKHFKNNARENNIKLNQPASKAPASNQPAELSNEIFTFNGENFTIQIEQEVRSVSWKQVQSMIAYKIDRFASDNICLDVFCDNNINFTITEESAAWDKFLDHSKTALPVIDKFWEIEIVALAFETTPTVVYDRQNRDLKEIIKKNYKE